jgi:hypothetical protein
MSGDDSGLDSEEEEIPQEEKDRDLFNAAKLGNLAAVKTALEMGASPTHTGGDGWSPLLWSSCNGHLEVAELLMNEPHNAANPYVAKGVGSAGGFGQAENVSSNSSTTNKATINSPLHWASFKGHLNIVWALLKLGLSPYDTDSCGNTSLHLAATGGNIEVLKCLMSEGFDISQRNVYGNTAYELADKPNVRQVLKKAMEEKGCYASGKKFSAAVWRYYCTHSGHFYCDSETVRDSVVVKVGSSTTKPVRYCKSSQKKIQTMEATLQTACKGTLTRDNLAPLGKAVKNARNNGCNVVWIHKGERTLTRLTAECVMRDEMELVEKSRPIGSKKQLKRLVQLRKNALEEGVREEDGIEECEALLKATEAEVTLCGVSSLVEAIECASPANESEIKRLDEALDHAIQYNAQEALVADRQVLQKKLHAELDMNRYMAPPGEEAVVDEEGEPTEHCKYTMFDGKTVFNTSVPGDKLKCLQFRFEGLTKALASAGDVGTCHGPLVESATEYEATLSLDVQEEEAREVDRIAAEEKAAAKAAKKKKKMNKK